MIVVIVSLPCLMAIDNNKADSISISPTASPMKMVDDTCSEPNKPEEFNPHTNVLPEREDTFSIQYLCEDCCYFLSCSCCYGHCHYRSPCGHYHCCDGPAYIGPDPDA